MKEMIETNSFTAKETLKKRKQQQQQKTIFNNLDDRLIKKTVPVDRSSMCVHTSKLLEISLGLCSEEKKMNKTNNNNNEK